MKKIYDRAINIIPHITVILCIMFITFWILDICNPMMQFIDNAISNVLLLILCISGILTSIIAVGSLRKNP